MDGGLGKEGQAMYVSNDLIYSGICGIGDDIFFYVGKRYVTRMPNKIMATVYTNGLTELCENKKYAGSRIRRRISLFMFNIY